ncbi:MAG TPA: hypothetical protein VGR43_02095 [Dehalococcoidia bacterium]|nr:hypothetical protein [Dehalococcoidia bacterium]
MAFIPRREKAAWGIPCNQNADGDVFVGKGYEKSVASQFGVEIERAVKRALQRGRGDRNGRFWVDLETRQIKMAVRESADNEYGPVSF